jgi:hypothetical protein
LMQVLPDESGVPMAIGTPHSCGSLTRSEFRHGSRW